MAVESEKFRTAGFYESLIDCNSTFVERERLLADAQLRDLANDPNKAELLDPHSAKHTTVQRLLDVEDQIRGNIDALDYLRGISGLEKPFTDLVKEVFRAALVLSQEDEIPHPERVFDLSMNEKVDRCWNYITQLTDAVQWHVTQAVRYHKFHHELKTAQLQLQQLTRQSEEALRELQLSDIQNLNQLKKMDKLMEENLRKLDELADRARQLCIQSKEVPPLQSRRLNPSGQHSAQLLTSMRLTDGTWLHRGQSVRVWANSRSASELHNEWQATTLDGKHSVTLPSVCLWLTSPEPTPQSSLRAAHSDAVHGVKSKRSSAGNLRTHRWGSDSCSGNRASAAHLQQDVLNTWMENINEFGHILLPTYKNYLDRFAQQQEYLSVPDVSLMNKLLETVKPLVDYGGAEETAVLEQLHRKSIRQSDQPSVVTIHELRQLLRTLSIWNEMREHLKQAKLDASMRSMNKELFRQAPPSSLGLRVQPVGSRSELPARSAREQLPSPRSGRSEELVTSFADPAPKTYRVVQDGSEQHIEPTEQNVIRAYRNAHFASDHSEGLKRTRSQPTGVAGETQDLMTQITTPCIPTVVHCPKCNLAYEIDVFSGTFLPEKDASAGRTTPVGIDVTEPTIIASPEPSPTSRGFEQTRASPMPTPILMDKTATPVNTHRKRCRRLFIFPQRRSQSCTTSTAELTDTSGLGSSPDLVKSKDKRKSRKKRASSGKPPAEEPRKRSRTPFFRWGKRSRPTTPETPKLQPRDSVIAWKGSTEFKPMSSPVIHIDTSTPTQPVLRSRSWVQQGTPWGYGPPLHDQWHAVNDKISTEESRSARLPRFQSHSDRIVARACRPYMLTTSSDRTVWNTVDSGIQTDTDMVMSDTMGADLSPGSSSTIKPLTVTCEHCQHVQAYPSLQNISTHSVQVSQPETVFKDTGNQVLSKSYIEVGSQKDIEFSRGHVETWDVSCQVGVRTQEQGVLKDIPQTSVPAPEALEEPPIIFSQKATLDTTKVETRRTVIDSIRQADVTCQVGRVLVDVGIGPDMLEAVKILDESFGGFEAEPNGKMETKLSAIGTPTTSAIPSKTKVGKKLQVGTPWWQERSVDKIDRVTSPIDARIWEDEDEMGLYENLQSLTLKAKHQAAQTKISGEIKPQVPQKVVETQIGQVVRAEPIQGRKVEIPQEDSLAAPVNEPEIVASIARERTEKTSPKRFSTSTQIARTVTNKEQQTEIKHGMLLSLKPDTDSIGTEANIQPEQTDANVQTFLVKQSSTSTQIGDSGKRELSSERKFDTTIGHTISETATGHVQHTTVRVAPTHITTDSVTLPKTNPQIQKVTSSDEHEKAASATRSKRIQKGPPTVKAREETSTSEAEILDNFPEPIKTPVETAQHQKRTSSKSKRHHFVVDIGLHTDKYGKSPDTTTRHQLRGVSQPIPIEHLTEQDLSETNTTETASSYTDSDCSTIKREILKDSADSFRMRFYVRPRDISRHGRPQHRHKHQPRRHRSWSADDLDAHGPKSSRHVETKISKTYYLEREQSQIPSVRSDYFEPKIYWK